MSTPSPQDPFNGTSIAFLEHNGKDVVPNPSFDASQPSSETNPKAIITISKNNPDVTYLMMVFANWCGPCRMTKPEFAALSNVLKNDLNLSKFRLLGINVTGDESVRDTERNWGKLTNEWFDVRGYPTILLVKNGVVRGTHNGPRTVSNFIATMLGINDNPTCPERTRLDRYKNKENTK